jgi:hypothetical protein
MSLLNWLICGFVGLGLAMCALLVSSTIFMLRTHGRGVGVYLIKLLFLTLISLPLVIAMAIWAAMWLAKFVRSRIFGKHRSTAIAPQAAGDGDEAVVHLVHGTFESGAAWTRPGSPMRNRIIERNPHLRLEAFEWSGLNTQRGREVAAAKLASRLETSSSDEHYILAHSHGGNIVRDLSIGWPHLAPKIRGVCLLSTPFIHRKKIERTGREFTYMHAAGFVLLVELAAFAILAPFGAFNVVVGIATAVLALLIEISVSKRVEAELSAELARSVEVVDVSRVEILHAIGDEADSALRFVSFLHEACFGLFSQINAAARSTADKRYAPYAAATLIVSVLALSSVFLSELRGLSIILNLSAAGLLLACLKEKIRPSTSDWNLLVIAALPVGVLSYLLCAAKSLAYGDWRLMFSPNIFVFSSETPEGTHTMVKYAPREDGTLIHSTHSHPDAISDVADWLRSVRA